MLFSKTALCKVHREILLLPVTCVFVFVHKGSRGRILDYYSLALIVKVTTCALHSNTVPCPPPSNRESASPAFKYLSTQVVVRCLSTHVVTHLSTLLT